MATNSKEDLLALLSRETRFDKIQSKRKQKFMSLVSEEERTLAAEWMLEVVIDSGLKLDIFLLSVTIMDSFLDCCPILTNQVQLLASAALRLAAKVRDKMTINEAQIIEYTDNSITQTELEVIKMNILVRFIWSKYDKNMTNFRHIDISYFFAIFQRYEDKYEVQYEENGQISYCVVKVRGKMWQYFSSYFS